MFAENKNIFFRKENVWQTGMQMALIIWIQNILQ